MKLGGNFFEDLGPGQRLINPVPRTITQGDVALYIALTGDREPLRCSDEFARGLGFERAPVHDLLVFHIVFGRTVGEISLNSPGNLGYADLRFLRPVYTGDTLRAETETLGWRETSKGDTGVVWVRTVGYNQRDERVLQFYRWVMVNKRDPSTPTHADSAAEMPAAASLEHIGFPPIAEFDASATGGSSFWEDYEPGQRLAHPQGMTIEEAEHQLATRLYQNTARVHFNQLQQQSSRHGRRIIYGGHIISVAHALSFDGLENVVGIAAWNGGSHTNPTFAGDTLFAWTDVLERIELGRGDLGALRLRLVAVKNVDPTREDVALKVAGDDGRERYNANVVLDLDYVALIPKRAVAG
ncbi:MAG: MaoC family dehydratase [Dehalococcoidia bacterium]|nr:MAG: MaoC family dehydratase [Dehalococcoidia bacterium]